NPHSIAQRKTSHDFRRHENILRRLDKIPLRIAQKTETLTGNLDDAFAEFRFGLERLAILCRTLGWLRFHCIHGRSSGRIVVRVIAAKAIASVAKTSPAKAPSWTMLALFWRGGGFS